MISESDMNEIPIIFQARENPVASALDVRVKSVSKWAEFVAHLAQFGETSIPESKELIQMLVDQEADPELRAILFTGVGRCLIHEGDFIKGPKHFGYAYSLIRPGHRESRAFILLEMVAFMAIIGQYDLALIMLDHIPNLTRSEYLLKLANYYWAVLKTRKGNFDIIPTLRESLDYFLTVREFATAAYHYKNLGNAHRKSQNDTEALECYQQGLDISRQNHYRHIEAAIHHDVGMLYFHRGRHDQALVNMNLALDCADSHYMKSLTLGNIGLSLCRTSSWSEAEGYLQKSINIASSYGHSFLIPSIAYNLARCHEQLENHDLAFYFYKKGYEGSRELLNNHFTYAGYRKRVSERYIQILTDGWSGHTQQADIPDLSFALDKTWKEIRSIFQGGVLDILINTSGTVRQAAEDLNISPRSIFDIRKRSASFYTGPPQEYISYLLKNNPGTDWKGINQIFEREVFAFLYNEYGHNKKELSRRLGLNYQYTARLTKGIGGNSMTTIQPDNRP